MKELVIIVVLSSAGLYIISIMIMMLLMLLCHFTTSILAYAHAKREGYVHCCLVLHESKRLNLEPCAPCVVLEIFSWDDVCFSAWHLLLQLLVLPQSHLQVWLPCLLSYKQSIFRWKTSPFCGLLIGSCKQTSFLLAFTRVFFF